MKITPKIETSWLEVLAPEFEKPYFKEIKQLLVNEIQSGKTLFPEMKHIFHTFDKNINASLANIHGEVDEDLMKFIEKSKAKLQNVAEAKRKELGIEEEKAQ